MFWKLNPDHKVFYLKIMGRDSLETCCVLSYAVKILVLIDFALEMLTEEIKICDVYLVTIWIIPKKNKLLVFQDIFGEKAENKCHLSYWFLKNITRKQTLINGINM